MHTSNLPYVESFGKFCANNGISSASASSYIAYIEAAYNYLCPLIKFEYEGRTDNCRVLFENLDKLLKNNSGRKLAIFLFELLCNIKFDDQLSAKITKKYLSNIQTALRWFVAYLIAVCDGEEDKNPLRNNEVHPILGLFSEKVTGAILIDLKVRYPNSKSIFTKSDLIKIFTARVLTHDRVKGEYAVELPIRRISAEITYHKKQNKTFDKSLSQWIKEFLLQDGKVKFIVSGDGKETISLNEISSLKICDDGNVMVKVGKKEKPIFTELYKDKNSSGFISFGELAQRNKQPTEIRNLALDHDEPIFKVLKNKADGLNILKKFNALNGKHLSSDECKLLFDEFEDIHKYVAFTIMDQTENVKKGKK